jgi:hypothetical protein
MRAAALASVLLLATFVATAQDATTLDGQPAIRFMAGHAHLSNYCEGQLWITATRLRFDSSLGSAHSFDLKRADVKAFHPATFLRFHYMKLQTSGRTYRVGIYPSLTADLGDRFRFAERTWQDFPAAQSELQRAAPQRIPPDSVHAMQESGAPLLEFRAFAGPQFLWFRGAYGVTIWAKPQAAAEAYEEIEGKHAAGVLRVSAERVAFVPNDASATAFAFDAPRDEVRLYSGAAGYPRVVLNTRHNGRMSIVLGAAEANSIRFYDAAPLVRALGPEFLQLAAELLAAQK